jgi:hypothetical protein
VTALAYDFPEIIGEFGTPGAEFDYDYKVVTSMRPE